MPDTITSLRRAFRLIDPPPPERPADCPPVELRRGQPFAEVDVAAAKRLVGWTLPEDYRLLLGTYGPFTLAHPSDIDSAEFLTPARSLEVRAGLKDFLTKLASWVGPDSPEHAALAALPLESLLPVAIDYDSNGRTGWAFYCRGSNVLQQCHEKHGIETDADVTLEDLLVTLVCNFARWDQYTSRWYV